MDADVHLRRRYRPALSFGTQTQNNDYDLAGNPLLYRGNALEWEKGRRLKAFGDIEFTYDAGGVRQEKIFSDGFAHKFYTEGNVIHKEQRGYPTSPDGGARRHATLRYHYDQTGFCGIESSGVVYHVKKNLQGDVVMLVDGRENVRNRVVAKYVYDAWGNHKVYRTNTRGDNIEIYDSLTGTISGSETHIGNLNPFRYRGYYYDADIRLYYLQTRYYDPQVGRFINADAVDYADANVINGINLYAYCGNDPVNKTDPTGHFPLLLVLGIAALLLFTPIGGLVGQAVTSVACYAGMAVASIWDEDVRQDMNDIKWNPFNKNEAAVLGSNKVSFYKGAPVFLKDEGQSGSFFAISMNRNRDANRLKHEWGHNMQAMTMGMGWYGLCIGLPSKGEWGGRGNKWQDGADYFRRPWEAGADMFGGVTSHDGFNARTAEDELTAWNYWSVAMAFGPFAYLFLL